MTDEKEVKPLFDELALDFNPAMASKARTAKHMMDAVRESPEEARQFHLWRGIYAQTHGKVPDVADAFMAATVRERMIAEEKIAGLERLILRIKSGAFLGGNGTIPADAACQGILDEIEKAGYE
jgi:hypothetical protein